MNIYYKRGPPKEWGEKKRTGAGSWFLDTDGKKRERLERSRKRQR